MNYTSKTLNKGSTFILKGKTVPTATVTYKSNNTKVATVTNTGVVKGVNVGKAIITVSANGITKTCTVTVPYTITYKLNGGKNNRNNPSTYYGKKIALKNPTRKGYIFSGWYSDSKFKKKVTSFSSGNKTVYAKWLKVSVAKAKTPTLTNVSGRKLKIAYSATSGAKGYQIQYATNSKFTSAKTITTTKRNYTSRALTKNKTYYVRVRAYKLDSTNSKVYGSWSTFKTKKITK